MDVSRLLVRTRCTKSLNEVLNVKFDIILFNIKVMEDSYGHLRIVFLGESNRKAESLDS